jgi:hypothetical protein
MSGKASQFSAAEPGLGYVFQSRFALFKVLDLPEDGHVFIERNDDVEFVTVDGQVSLASLKHKAIGDRMSDLSVDFWKSVRIWANYYKGNGRAGSDARFLLYSTASVSDGSFLKQFLGGTISDEARAKAAEDALAASGSKEIAKVKAEMVGLTNEEAQDFYGRITIFPNTSRIDDIPDLIDQRLRMIRKEQRIPLFERLEGWWSNLVINVLTSKTGGLIRVQDVTDKLVLLNDEFKADSLPIDFKNKEPSDIDAANDKRTFVSQLKALELSEQRIRYAIIDYYRAFEQRSVWARENLVVSGEIEEYEDRLVEEWDRYRAAVCENITDESQDDACLIVGRELYRWAQNETAFLRIRERVTEPYVIRGAFQMLANDRPMPRVHWHPRFMDRLAKVLEVAA